MGMLKQVRAGFVDQPIGLVIGFFGHGEVSVTVDAGVSGAAVGFQIDCNSRVVWLLEFANFVPLSKFKKLSILVDK